VTLGDGTSLDLVCLGCPSSSTAGRVTLLAGFGAALAALLQSLASENAANQELMNAVTFPYGGMSLRGFAAPEASWVLGLSRRLLPAEAGVLLAAPTAEPVYMSWPESVDATGRRSLAVRAARSDGVVLAGDVGAVALAAAEAGDFVGAPVEIASGSASLVWFGPQPAMFDAGFVQAAELLAVVLGSGAPATVESVDLEVVQAAEARAMAGALHDGPVQQLTAAAMETEVALKLLERDPQEAATAIQRSGDEVRRVISQLRTLIFDLRSANVSELGLVDALRDYSDEFARRNGLALDLRLSPELPRLPAGVEQALFLIAREALINIEKHAGATAVRVAMESRSDGVSLRVEDNGMGLPGGTTLSGPGRDGQRHYGLLGIRERAERLGGVATITGEVNVGVSVEVVIPTSAEGGG
jgi:signal transduction histidine kinase